MGLRGFDDYEVTLGDEMRGQRASLGVDLADVERDLRIKAGTILSIENADLDGFPNHSVVPGHVRGYARYLGMDPERCYRRFCDETGFRSPTAPLAVAAGGAGRSAGIAINSRAGASLTESRFAPPPAPERIGGGVSLGAVGSTVALLALVGGLSYGGYHLLQDIQKVGVAPMPEVPEVVVEAGSPPEPAPDTTLAMAGGAARPDASAYEEGGILTLAASDPPPREPSRDGPIADLDPDLSGIFAPVGRLDPNDPRREGASLASAATPGEPEVPGWEDGVLLASLSAGAMAAEPSSEVERLSMSARASTQELSPEPETTVIRATGEAWVRVKDGDGTVIFEGILGAGEKFELPRQMRTPEIRAGNAGGVYIAIGDETFGPLGGPGQVVKNVSLAEEAIRANYPATEDLDSPVASGDAPVQSAEAAL